ncbi:hypothetical protein NW762_013494 [Fusarium torreyae]|uniref:Uncharacterized protein n=1 Tax=Fusarium torreyae TaxID=1237075 RepID=A0A9W8V7E0_9HYPO|nr:hypothetical protein NW762_013494 [Fusarium torreyae]
MHLLYKILLLMGMLFGPSWAVDNGPPVANMGIWEIDAACNSNMPYIQEGFDVALEMATAAYNAMEFLLKPQPDKKENPKDHLRWLIIHRAMEVTLGIIAKSNGNEKSVSWIDAQTVFSNIKKTLVAKQNSPSRGYNRQLITSDQTKPRLVCGVVTEGDNANFQWIDLDQPVPGQKDNSPLKSYHLAKKNMELGAVGGWFHYDRMMFKKVKREKNFLCGPGVSGQTSFLYDMIVICDYALRPKAKERISPKTYKEIETMTKKKKMRVGDMIKVGTETRVGTDLAQVARHLSVTVLHELTHWYGQPRRGADKKFELHFFNIDDRLAVGPDGRFLYEHRDPTKYDYHRSETQLTAKEMENEKVDPVKSYGRKHIWNLAKVNTNYRRMAHLNADSLAYFALMV